MLDLPLVIELLAVLFLYVGPHIVAFFFLRHASLEYGEPSSYLRVCGLLRTVGLSFLILYIALWEESGLASIGFKSSTGGLLLLGFFVANGLIILQSILTRCLSQEAHIQIHDRDLKLVNACKTPAQRMLHITHMLTIGVEEELFFRGYLILLWGQRSGALVLCAVISGIFCLFAHWDHFRNRQVLLSTVCFTLVISWMTVVTASILPALSAHCYMNLFAGLKVMAHVKSASKTRENNKA